MAMQNVEVCLKFPPKISSPGIVENIVNKENTDQILDFIGTTLHLQLVVIFALTQSLHFFFKRLGLPMLISQITTGIILGRTILGNDRILGDHSEIAFSEESLKVLGTMSAFGYMFYMFLCAVKMDLSLVKKAGKKDFCIGLLFISVPLLCGILLNIILESKDENTSMRFTNVFLTIFYSGSTFPVVHSLLNELKIINSDIGRLSLLAAMISDVLSLTFMNIGYVIKIAVDGDQVFPVIIRNFAYVLAIVLVAIYFFRPVTNWMIRRTPSGAPIRSVFLYAIIVMFLFSPKLAKICGLFILYGPTILGLAVPDGPPLGSTLVEKFDTIVNGLLLPLFVTTCAMRIDFTQLDISVVFVQHQVIIALMLVLVKFGVSLVLPFFCDMPMGDCLALSFMMNAKGIVELGSFTFLNDSQIIHDNLFTLLIIITMVMAITSPTMVKLFYDPSRKYASYQKRNIMNCKLHEELRMVTCIHVPSDVTTIINLLNSSCPTSRSPLTINVLHLVKLIGRSTPLFISHEKHKKTIFNSSYSENVVLAFNQFERDNWDAMEVNVFTAVSPSSFMHEDICNLALDKFTSLIILPFHRRWSIDGTIESEDQAIRILNCNILKTSPCSVGILVEGRRILRRSHSKDVSSSLSMYSIVVIFLGGHDDREALILAKRFSLDARVNLTVIHLKTPNILGNMLVGHDKMLDEEVLEDVKNNEYVTYIEEDVRDGPETSTFLRSIVSEHNLIIVGRQYDVERPQTDGLKEWSEFPELGIIGDLLACADFSGAYSLLVIQKQHQHQRIY